MPCLMEMGKLRWFSNTSRCEKKMGIWRSDASICFGMTKRMKPCCVGVHGSVARIVRSSGDSGSGMASTGGGREETLADVMANIFSSMADAMSLQNAQQVAPTGAHVFLQNLEYHPAGSDVPLLHDVSMCLEPNTLGLIYGCSGGGKSTLLNILAGLARESSGKISFGGPVGETCDSIVRMKDAGLVFQFPERHFLGDTLAEELTASWPSGTPEAMYAQQILNQRTHRVLAAVGLQHIPFDTKLEHLSGGYKRRVALAVQLVRQPKLLLLDEPLAGLDWKARHDLVGVLASLRSECTVLVVSHDLGEINPLVDSSWRMHRGGRLTSAD